MAVLRPRPLFLECDRRPRSARFNFPTSSGVFCQLPDRTVSAWTSTIRLMLFFDGRSPRYAFPVLAECIRPAVWPKKFAGAVRNRTAPVRPAILVFDGGRVLEQH